MSGPGTPTRDAAGAACRNAAAAIDDLHTRVKQAVLALPGDERLHVLAALTAMDRAATLLDKAADHYYREEAPK